MLCCTSSLAGEDKFAIKFDYMDSVPATVRLQTSSGFKTLRCGTARIGDKGSPVLLHLYTRPKTKAHKSYLDLFVRRTNRFRRINSITLSGVIDTDLSYGSPSMVWLDTAHHKEPIVPLITFPDNPEASEYDQRCCLLIFKHGVAKRPIMQKFQYYAGFESHLILFERTDKHGYIVLNH